MHDNDPNRRVIKNTMKMLSGPYPAFEMYHTLEDTIELYNEIWYESSSSDFWAMASSYIFHGYQKDAKILR